MHSCKPESGQDPEIHTATALDGSASPAGEASSNLERKGRFLASTTMVSTMHSGPLPPASELAEYDRLIPGGADRLMILVEKQASHRMEIEKHVIWCQQQQAVRGQLFAMLIVMFGFVLTGYLSIQGHDTVASVVVGTGIVGIISVIATGKMQIHKSLQQKRPEKPEHLDRSE